MRHNFKVIEKKWQKKWEDAKVFEAQDFSDKKKFYGLVEFPYPSGAGMHVGHIKAYSSVEVVSRKRRMEGYNVLFPIGFDAFGLPTENYAIKTGTHPRQITDQNIARFTEQLKRVGCFRCSARPVLIRYWMRSMASSGIKARARRMFSRAARLRMIFL